MSSPRPNNPHDVVDDHHCPLPIETSDTFWPFLQDNIDSLLLPLQNNINNGGTDVENHPGKKYPATITSTSIEKRQANIFTHGQIDDIFDTIEDNYFSHHHQVSDDQTLLDHEQEKVSDDLLLTSVMKESAMELLACNDDGMDHSGAVPGEQSSSLLVESGMDEKIRQEERVEPGKIKQRHARTMHKANKAEGSTSKKEEHNAKEKVRRMKLNASYLALASLLPHSRRPKKRRSAPVIIDKVVEYIPEIETEIEKLKLKKDNLHSKTETKKPMQPNENAEVITSVPAISMHQVKEGEVIVQFCLPKKQQKKLSDVLLNIEEEGMAIASASSIDVCEDNICYHLHLKLDGDPLGVDYVALLKEKITSWLC